MHDVNVVCIIINITKNYFSLLINMSIRQILMLIQIKQGKENDIYPNSPNQEIQIQSVALFEQ